MEAGILAPNEAGLRTRVRGRWRLWDQGAGEVQDRAVQATQPAVSEGGPGVRTASCSVCVHGPLLTVGMMRPQHRRAPLFP